MEQKSVKVNCSFCGAEIECPEHMLKDAEKHMCFECFQDSAHKLKNEEIEKVHIDIPKDKIDEVMPKFLLNQIMHGVFPDVWSERKNELKELSKKDLAKEMFAEGVRSALDFMREMDEQFESEENEAG